VCRWLICPYRLIFLVIPNAIHTFLIIKSDITLHINHTILLFADNATYIDAMFIVDNTRRVICVCWTLY
jgi:hypothetical protein